MTLDSVFYAVEIDASVTMDRIDRVWRGTRIFESGGYEYQSYKGEGSRQDVELTLFP